MSHKIWLNFISFVCTGAVICNASTDKKYNKDDKCWMSLRAPEFFSVIEKIDKEYATARKEAQHYLELIDFNKRMLEKKLVNGVVVHQDFSKGKVHDARMPGGLNLGGMCMMKMPNSVFFFHRMALRNDTNFRVNVLHNDIENMVLRGHLSLNGLHLTGGYDRCLTDHDPSVLRYTDSLGQVQIFLEDIKYTIEGRYRLVKDRLVIEQIVSKLFTKHIFLTYAIANETDNPTLLDKRHMGDFIIRLKTDLDKWMQDYFNDHLLVTDLNDVPNLMTLRQYDGHKTTKLAVFTDTALAKINSRIRSIAGDYLRVPTFSIVAAYGLSIKIFDGALRGMDTMYRRSAATTSLKRKTLRYVDTIIGFSDLKVSYKYEVNFPGPTAPPALTGVLTMSAKDLTAHLSLGLISEPEVVELDINFLKPMGPEAITVEGAANILQSNFKHILHHEIATLMSNSLIYGTGLLRSLPRCVPFVPGIIKKKTKSKASKTPTFQPSHQPSFNNNVLSS